MCRYRNVLGTCTATIDYARLLLKDLETEKSFGLSSDPRESCDSEKRRKRKKSFLKESRVIGGKKQDGWNINLDAAC